MSGIVSCSQLRAFERAVIDAGAPSLTLMERAGQACAAAIDSRITPHSRVAVLAGPGNNGGDGYVVSRILAGLGHKVRVFGVGAATADARHMAALQQTAVEPPDPAALRQFAPQAIVDALFGIGLSRAPDSTMSALIDESNRLHGSGALVAAVDLPSGYPGDGGDAFGAAIKADLTVTFHAMKPVHVLYPGRAACGEIIVADIGLGPNPEPSRYALNERPEILARSAVEETAHKYDRGHALVLAGGIEGAGAARLSARAALRAGAGLVTLGVPEAALLAHASRGPDALMVRKVDGSEGLASILADKRKNAAVVGPAYGVGATTREAVRSLLGIGRSVVLDADALMSFEGDVMTLRSFIEAGSGEVVITPHAGEFLRLFKDLSGVSEALHQQIASKSKLERALAAAVILGVTVVYKGADTVIAAPDGRCLVNLNAPPWLGTAGSGDVLAGMIGGLLAQGLSGFDAARAAVWLHGEAGNVAGRGLIADDLPETLWTVFRNAAAAAAS